MSPRMPSFAPMARASALGVLFSVFIFSPAWAGVGGSLDIVFPRSGLENLACLNDGAGGFTCSDMSMDLNASFGVALGDVDGVNGLDAVFVIQRGANVVCLNDGAGGFTCSDMSMDLNDSIDVALGDVDGDNDLDAIIANLNNFQRKNQVCLNDGSGSFTCSDINADLNNSAGVALGDMDGDNDLDAVFANLSNKGNRLCLNNGSGTFTCSDVSTDINSSFDVALGDVDGMNGLDMVFANGDTPGQRNRVCLNDGSGSFTCSDAGTDVNLSAGGVALGDMDGDNDLDAVFASRDSGLPSRLCLNNGSATFTCSDISPDTLLSNVALGDVDGDDDLDAVFSRGGSSPHRVCLNNGSGGFACSDVSSDISMSLDVALGDLTGPSVPPVPALSLRGSLFALLLLTLGGTIVSLSRRRRRGEA